MKKNGNIVKVIKNYKYIEDLNKFIITPYGYSLERILEYIILAKDAAHAIKITSEKRAQLIAENAWK